MKLELPIFDRNQGKTVAPREPLWLEPAQIPKPCVCARGGALHEIYEELNHSIHRAEILRDEVIPTLRGIHDEHPACL